MNTERTFRLARSVSSFGSYEKGGIGSLPIVPTNRSDVMSQARLAYIEAALANSYSETDPNFVPALRVERGTLEQQLAALSAEIRARAVSVLQAMDQIEVALDGVSGSTQGWRVEYLNRLADGVSPRDVMSELVG